MGGYGKKGAWGKNFGGGGCGGGKWSSYNRRKIWVVYWSHLELGEHGLDREEAWSCACAQRSGRVAQAAAGSGSGRVMGHIVKQLFRDGHDPNAGDVFLETGGRSVRLFHVLSIFLSDGGAHRSVWHCKGDAGAKLCMPCRDLVCVARVALARCSVVQGSSPGHPILHNSWGNRSAHM